MVYVPITSNAFIVSDFTMPSVGSCDMRDVMCSVWLTVAATMLAEESLPSLPDCG